MSTSPTPALKHSADSRGLPCFVVGVTGHLSLSAMDHEYARNTLRLILQHLSSGRGDGAAAGDSGARAADQTTVDHPLLRHLPKLGLPPHCLLLMSSLAPGADQLAAEVARDLNIRVLAPLPFLPSGMLQQDKGLPDGAFYVNQTTFCWPEADSRENASRQSTFNTLVAGMQPQDLFLVRLTQDSESSLSEVAQRLAADSADEGSRNRRYRAAGEYIATACDLLIAICDQEQRPSEFDVAHPIIPKDGECGASAIIRTRLFGTTPDLLPDVSALTWSDHGPVLRIWVENGRRARVQSAGQTDQRRPAPALWSPESDRFAAEVSPSLEQREYEQLQSLASEILKLRALPRPQMTDEERMGRLLSEKAYRIRATELEGLLERWWRLRRTARQTAGGANGAVILENRWDQNSAYSAKLQRLAALFHSVNHASQKADGTIKRLLKYSPWLAFSGFCVLQVTDNLQVVESTSHWVVLLKFLSPFLWMVLFAIPWIWHLRHRRRNVGQRQEDYRAFAEAIRVQFYWALAGLGKSTAQFYLQRERGELSWIRAALSSAVMPCSDFSDEFQSLTVQQQTHRLKRVHAGWIRTQQNYFRRVAAELHERLQKLSILSRVLLWTGLSLLLLCTSHGRPWLTQHLQNQHATADTLALAAAIGSGFSWFLIVMLRRYLRQVREAAYVRGRAGIPVRVSGLQRCWYWISWVLRCYAISVVLGLLSAWISVTLISQVQTVPSLFRNDPGSFQMSLVVILRNLCFAGYAVLVARMTYHFLPQNVPRYRSMLALYRSAGLRMTALMQRLESQSDAADQAAAIRSIQSLLQDLGAEALTENAEWLKMHRISPPSPLLPSP